MHFRQPSVAALAQAMGVDSPGYGGLAACAHRVAGLPCMGFLFDARAVLDLLQRTGHQDEVAASTVGIAGAGLSIRAFSACGAGEEH